MLASLLTILGLLLLSLGLFVWLKMRVLVFTLLITILTGIAAVAAYFAVHFVRNRMQHLIATILIWMLQDAIKQRS